MTSRERVSKALAHEEPDRVPYNLRPSEEMKERLQQEQNNSDVDFSEFFKHDIRYVTIPLPKCPEDVPQHEWVPRPNSDEIGKAKEQTEVLQGRGLAVCGAYACGVFEQTKHWHGDADRP